MGGRAYLKIKHLKTTVYLINDMGKGFLYNFSFLPSPALREGREVGRRMNR